MADKTMEQFYQDLQTLPRLLSDLALSVAEAQRRMDENYLDSLTKFAAIVQALPADKNDFKELFKSMAPSRYQFTETVVECRADLQMANATDLNLSGSAGIKTTMLAVTVNAAYAKRNAYNYEAAALIRSVMHAVSSDQEVMSKLLTASNNQTAKLPDDDRFKAISESLGKLALAKT